MNSPQPDSRGRVAEDKTSAASAVNYPSSVEPPPPSWLAADSASENSGPAAESTQPVEEPQLYMYDPTGGQSSHRGLLIAVLILLVLGIVGVFYLMHSSPAKPAPGKASSSNIGITISPSTAEVQPGNALDVTARVTNGNGTEVGWVVQEGMEGGRVVPRSAVAEDDGSINLKAVYVAPQEPGTYHLVVTSKADESKSAEATITVKK